MRCPLFASSLNRRGKEKNLRKKYFEIYFEVFLLDACKNHAPEKNRDFVLVIKGTTHGAKTPGGFSTNKVIQID